MFIRKLVRRFKLPQTKTGRFVLLACFFALFTGSLSAAYFVTKPNEQVRDQTSNTEVDKVVSPKPTEEAIVTQETPVEPEQPAKTQLDAQTTTQSPPAEPEFNPYSENTASWYVYERRIEVGLPIKVGLGTHCSFTNAAKQFGYVVDQQPTLYAIVQIGRGSSGCTVGVVETVADDSFTMSTYVEAYQSSDIGVSILTYQNSEVSTKQITFAH